VVSGHGKFTLLIHW